jgi:hypothetical protein
VLNLVDVDAVLEHVDLNRQLERIDVNALLDRIDIDQLLQRVDIDALVDRVDVNRLVSRVDVDDLVQRTELGAIIADSTSGVAQRVLDSLRARAVALDALSNRVTDRVMRRKPGEIPRRPTGRRVAGTPSTPATP